MKKAITIFILIVAVSGVVLLGYSQRSVVTNLISGGEPLPFEPPSEPESLSEEEVRDKAVIIARSTIGQMGAIEVKPEYRFGESISENAEKILIENTGLMWAKLRDLTLTCLRDNGKIEVEHVRNDKRFIAYIDVLAHYLELTFLHPDAPERFIKLLLEERCGKQEVYVEAVKAMKPYYPPSQIDELVEDWLESFKDPAEEEEEGVDAADAPGT